MSWGQLYEEDEGYFYKCTGETRFSRVGCIVSVKMSNNMLEFKIKYLQHCVFIHCINLHFCLQSSNLYMHGIQVQCAISFLIKWP